MERLWKSVTASWKSRFAPWKNAVPAVENGPDPVEECLASVETPWKSGGKRGPGCGPTAEKTPCPVEKLLSEPAVVTEPDPGARARQATTPVPRIEAVLVLGVTFGSVATFAAAFVAWLLGSLSPGVGAFSLLAAAVAGWLAMRQLTLPSGQPAAQRWTRWEWLAVTAFAAVSVRQFGWLVFERDGALLTLLPHNYGDLPLHWTYVQHLASGAAFWPENPILTHERLRYPFGVDLLTAVFVQLGASLPIVLPLMGLAGAALAALALRRWGGAFSVAGFLFAGGLAGLPVVLAFTLADVDGAVAWKNLFLALFVPQRGFLLALPAGLVLLASWRARLLRRERAATAEASPGLREQAATEWAPDDGGYPVPAWVEGLLWSALPLVHLHTFAFVSVAFAAWAIGSGRWRRALPSLAVAVLPATWAVVQVTDGFRAASLVGWAPGWVIDGAGPLVFLIWNFGLFLPLAVAALVLAARRRLNQQLLVLVPALGLFALLFVVRLAPWAWDNTKVMLWCYVAVLPVIEAVTLARLRAWTRAGVVVLLFFSGALSLLWACVGRLPRLEVLDRSEYGAVCVALASVPTTRVATVQTFNHPVGLCGRPIVAGYAGHLWSHGLEASTTEARLKRLLQGEPGWQEDARALGASHVFWGRREAAAFPASAQPWRDRGAPIAEGPWGALYRLN